jgi:hypothetical protein
MSIMVKPRERDAIVKSLAAGVVPTIGLHHIQVDRKDEIMAMIGDLERIREGGASVRFVIGRYGTGKSFFLNLTKSVALAEKFVVMQADVAQKRRLASSTGYARNLYSELVSGMATKLRPDGGAIEAVFEGWMNSLREQYGEDFDVRRAVRGELKPLQALVGGYHFTAAVTKYCEARLSGDEDGVRASKKWLAGGYDKLTEAKAEIAIDSYVGDKDIYDYLKLWGAFTKIAGYSGMLILMDEMGVLAQALSNSVARVGNYEVILQIVNDCLQGRVSGIGFLFAGADYFLEDRKTGLMSHGALASRLSPNPFARDGLKDFSTPIIRLGDFSPEDLYLLLENIREVFAMGDKSRYLVPDEAIQSFMSLCSWSLGPEFYKTPRDAVKLFTGFLSVLEQNSQVCWQNLLDGAVIERSGGEPAAAPEDDDPPRRLWRAPMFEPEREAFMEPEPPLEPPVAADPEPELELELDEEGERTREPERDALAEIVEPALDIDLTPEAVDEPFAAPDEASSRGEEPETASPIDEIYVAEPEFIAEPEMEGERALVPEPEEIAATIILTEPEMSVEPTVDAEPGGEIEAGTENTKDTDKPEEIASADSFAEEATEPALETLPLPVLESALPDGGTDLQPEIEPEFELEFGLDDESGLGDVAFASGPDADPGAEDFDFEFDASLDLDIDQDCSSDPGLGLGPGGGMYIVESRPDVYDQDILYIMPDAGSPREVSLRLVKPEAALEAVAVREAPRPAVSADEEDMRVGHLFYDNENSLKVFLPNMIARSPLIGLERIPSSVHNDLVRMSGKILINAYNDYLPNSYEKMLLTVALINIAKRWSSEDETAFWNFLCRQLGFEKEAHETLYGTMCNAIYETMKSRQRFFSTDHKTGKREFYATIMVHALSSRESMFAWFDFLFDFYRDNLRGVVMKNDPAVGCLVDTLREILDDAPDPGDAVLKGRQSPIRTGLMTLLMKRPAYFKTMTCGILEKLDCLSSGRKLENDTYLDDLINYWFARKAPVRVERSGSPGRIAAAYAAIRPRYEVAESNSVALVIPPVRICERVPGCYGATAEIHCGENVFREELEVYGDEFAWTIAETRIVLSGLSDFASADDMRARVKIFVGDRMIYDSRTSLYREVIVFDGDREIPPRRVGPGLFSVFSSRDRELSFDQSGDVRVVPAESGQMRAVMFTRGYGISLGGRIICSDGGDGVALVEATSPPIAGLSFEQRGNEYDVWSGDFAVRAKIHANRDLRSYAFKVGGRYYPVSECAMEPDEGLFVCTLDVTGDMIDDCVCDVAIVETSPAEREVCRRGFCVLPGVSVSFDRPYYCGGAHGGTVRVEAGSLASEAGLGDDDFALAPFGEGHIKARVPVVTWHMEPLFGKPGAPEGRAVWRGNVAAWSKLIVVCPDEVSCRLKIGDLIVDHAARENGEAVFDIGRALRSGEICREEEIIQVELIMESEDDSSGRVLFPICLRETFEEPPVFEMRGGTLTLKNPWAFVGPGGARLEYAFKGRACASYQSVAGESAISESCSLPHGSYQCRVFSLHAGGSPDDKHIIYSGTCILGDVDIFHFDNKLLEIRRVRAGFKEFFILPVYVENLEFVETEERYDDGVAYPVYSGTCYYLNRDDEKVFFGDDFNPARIVIINGRDVCLYKRDGNKPYLIYDSRHKLTAAKPDAASGVVYYVPDFYEYEAIEGN